MSGGGSTKYGVYKTYVASFSCLMTMDTLPKSNKKNSINHPHVVFASERGWLCVVGHCGHGKHNL